MTENEARAQAERIRKYWELRGANVEVKVVKENVPYEYKGTRGDTYTLRSNMRAGYPRGV